LIGSTTLIVVTIESRKNFLNAVPVFGVYRDGQRLR
jgi:hypothetical protein